MRRTILYFKQLKMLTFTVKYKFKLIVKYKYIPRAVSHHVPGIPGSV